MKKTVKAVILAMLFLLTATMQSFNAANAANKLDPSQSASLTLLCPFSNIEVRIFYVADVEDDGTLVTEEAFQDYRVEISENISSPNWEHLAKTLALYAERDKITPTRIANEYSNGIARFEGLECGLYLITVNPTIIGSEIIITQPIMVSLPTFDENSQEWDYDVTAKPKNMKRSTFTGLNIEVVKIWNDEGKEINRPIEIEVELLRNGEVFETVILNEENNWRHAWYGLAGAYDWSTIEKAVPDGYTVIVMSEGLTDIITNTATEDALPNTPTPVPSLTPEPSVQPTASPTPPPKLPQTGQLWWPVGLLTSCGLIIFFLGLIKKRND